MTWREVKTVPFEMFELYKDLLAQDGIDTVIEPGDVATSFLGSAARPVRLMVEEKDLDKARGILDAWDSGEIVYPEDSDGGEPEDD